MSATHYGDEGIRALVGMLGKTGTGKSSILRKYARKCRRLLVADVEASERAQAGDEIVVGAGPLLDRLEAIGADDPRKKFRIIYRDSLARMQVVIGEVAMHVRHLTLAIHELSYFSTANKIAGTLQRPVLMGRRAYVNILWTTQRPQLVHNSFFDQAQLLHFFRVDPGLGLDAIRKYYPDLSTVLPTLGEHPPPLDFRTFGNPKIVSLFGKEGLA